MKEIEKLGAAGGTAFPANTPLIEGGVLHSPGMTILDWFAGQALAGVILEESRMGNNMYSNESVAKTAYGIAAAMLAERSKS